MTYYSQYITKRNLPKDDPGRDPGTNRCALARDNSKKNATGEGRRSRGSGAEALAEDIGSGVEGVGVLVGRADQDGVQAGRAQRGRAGAGWVAGISGAGGEVLVDGGLKLAQWGHVGGRPQAAQGSGHHGGGSFGGLGVL